MDFQSSKVLSPIPCCELLSPLASWVNEGGPMVVLPPQKSVLMGAEENRGRERQELNQDFTSFLLFFTLGFSIFSFSFPVFHFIFCHTIGDFFCQCVSDPLSMFFIILYWLILYMKTVWTILDNTPLVPTL